VAESRGESSKRRYFLSGAGEGHPGHLLRPFHHSQPNRLFQSLHPRPHTSLAEQSEGVSHLYHRAQRISPSNTSTSPSFEIAFIKYSLSRRFPGSVYTEGLLEACLLKGPQSGWVIGMSRYFWGLFLFRVIGRGGRRRLIGGGGEKKTSVLREGKIQMKDVEKNDSERDYLESTQGESAKAWNFEKGGKEYP